MRTKFYLTATVAAFSLLLSACSGGSTPLKELAEIYAEIADNNQKMAEDFQAVYKAPRDQQEALQKKAISTAEEVKAKNEKLAEKAASIGEKLQGKEVKCEASTALGVTVKSASFTTVNAQDKFANIVITAEVEGTPNGTPYFFLMDGKEVVYKSAARYTDGAIAVNFRITTNSGPETAREIARTKSVMLVTLEEFKAGAVSDTPAPSTVAEPEPEPEPAYEGTDNSNSVEAANSGSGKIEKGANLVDVLKAAGNVSYEYNADSGIWAHIGNLSIIIDEADLNQKGIDFINSILSDIEPNLAFSPEYLKPDAKIRQIEQN